MNDKVDPFQNEGFLKRLDELRKDLFQGDIKDLALFQKVKLSEAGVPWTAPFYYWRARDQREVFEAFKIKTDPAFKVIVRLWAIYGPGLLIISEYRDGKTRVMSEVDPLTRVDLAATADQGNAWPGLDHDAERRKAAREKEEAQADAKQQERLDRETRKEDGHE